MFNWWGSIKATLVSGAIWLVALVGALSAVYEKVKDGPSHGLKDVLIAAFTPTLPLAGTVIAILSGVATIAQFFAPKPASETLVRATSSVLDRRAAERQVENLGEHQRTQTELASLTSKIDTLTAQLTRSQPQQAEIMGKALTSLASSGDDRDFEIAKDVVGGDYAGAYAALVDEAKSDKKRSAERFRQAAQIVAPFEPSKALRSYGDAAELDPDDVWTWIELGRLRSVYESLDSARRCFDIAAQQVTSERDLMVLDKERADLEWRVGNKAAARALYKATYATAERRAAAAPDDPVARRDLWGGHIDIGDTDPLPVVRRRHFDAALEIAANGSRADPENEGLLADTALTLNRLGDAIAAGGRLDERRERYEAALKITEKLAAKRPNDVKRAMSFWHQLIRLGTVLHYGSDLSAADAIFDRALSLIKPFAEAEPDNSLLQHDLAWSYCHKAQIAEANGDLDATESLLDLAGQILDPVAKRWPDDSYIQETYDYIKGDLERLRPPLSP